MHASQCSPSLPLGMYRTGGRWHWGKMTPLQRAVCNSAEHLEGVRGLESAQVVAAVGQPHAQRGRAGSTGGWLWLERRTVGSPPRRQRHRSVRQPPLLRLFFCSAQPQQYTSYSQHKDKSGATKSSLVCQNGLVLHEPLKGKRIKSA